jgi:hypothetical protein
MSITTYACPAGNLWRLQTELLRITAQLSTEHNDRDLGAVSKSCAGIISTENWVDSKQTSHKSLNGHIRNIGQGETTQKYKKGTVRINVTLRRVA